METKPLIDFQNLERVLKEYAEAVRSKYVENLTDDNRPASGKLESVKYQVQKGRESYEVSLNLQKYWEYVEYGTRPHYTPYYAILEWIRVKPVIPRPNQNGLTPTDRQLAGMIKHKIETAGTEGKDSLRRTLREINAEYEQKIAEALSNDIGQAIQFFFTSFEASFGGE